MAPTIEDRWLWLGLGVFTFLAIKGVSHGLRQIVHITEVHTPPPQPRIPPPKGKQDAIKTASLQTLATCNNVEIRKAATKILCERFIAHGAARTLLLKDLQSDDPDARHAAQLAFNLLCDYDVLQHDVAPPPTPQMYRPRATRHGGGGRTPRRTLPWLPGISTARNRGNRDPEERDLRRRRREAMVINEGDRPLSQQDVWMRDGEGRMSTEEQVQSRSALEALTGQQAEAEV